MDRNDTDRLFTLLEQFWPNKRAGENKKRAWALALEPYEYTDIKTAAISYARCHKFFPDLADLTATVKAVSTEPPRDDSALLRKMLDKGAKNG